MALSVIEDISVFKHEYMDMSVPALVGVGEVGEVRLRDHVGQSDFLCVLFYPADFTQLVREEIIEAERRVDDFKSAKCQLFACSVDSPQVHQAWVNAPATEHDEADGLGRMPPFPLLGDKNMRFCRSLGVLDEATGTARHALYLINADGDLVFRAQKDDDDQKKPVDFGAMLELLKNNKGEEADKDGTVVAEFKEVEEAEVIMTKRDIVDDVIVEEDEEGEEEEDGIDIDLDDPMVEGATKKIQAAFKAHKARKEAEAMRQQAGKIDEVETPKEEEENVVEEAAVAKLEDPESVEVDEGEKKSGTCDNCQVGERCKGTAPLKLSEVDKEVTKTQESLDKPGEKLQQRLSFAAEEQEDEIEVHEVHEVVDFVDSGEVIKKEEEKSVQEADQIAKPEDEDEGVQMREDDDGGDLLDPSDAPNVGMDPRMSIVDLEASLKRELSERKVVGMTLDDGDKNTSTNGAAAAKNKSAADDATAKKKKKGCCVIS